MDYIDEARKIINDLKLKKKDTKTGKEEVIIKLKTSQLRKFLAAVNAINNRIAAENAGEELSEKIANEIKYLKVKLLYQAGRNNEVKDFIKKANLLDRIDEIGNNKIRFQEFARFIEAIVAFRKFEGGDN